MYTMGQLNLVWCQLFSTSLCKLSLQFVHEVYTWPIIYMHFSIHMLAQLT